MDRVVISHGRGATESKLAMFALKVWEGEGKERLLTTYSRMHIPRTKRRCRFERLRPSLRPVTMTVVMSVVGLSGWPSTWDSKIALWYQKFSRFLDASYLSDLSALLRKASSPAQAKSYKPPDFDFSSKRHTFRCHHSPRPCPIALHVPLT